MNRDSGLRFLVFGLRSSVFDLRSSIFGLRFVDTPLQGVRLFEWSLFPSIHCIPQLLMHALFAKVLPFPK